MSKHDRKRIFRHVKKYSRTKSEENFALLVLNRNFYQNIEKWIQEHALKMSDKISCSVIFHVTVISVFDFSVHVFSLNLKS